MTHRDHGPTLPARTTTGQTLFSRNGPWFVPSLPAEDTRSSLAPRSMPNVTEAGLVLVLNSGSATVKFALIIARDTARLIAGT